MQLLPVCSFLYGKVLEHGRFHFKKRSEAILGLEIYFIRAKSKWTGDYIYK